ncbi:hypothetical protein Tco_0564420, partial [Tanacetum coccineum]
ETTPLTDSLELILKELESRFKDLLGMGRDESNWDWLSGPSMHTMGTLILQSIFKLPSVRNSVMSSASSAVTYTSVYTDSEPGRVFWGADEGRYMLERLPRVMLGYDGLPMQPVDPPSPDYVPGPEHPASPDYVPGPEHPPSPIEIPFVPEPEYPEYLVPSEDEAPMEDQPLPADASPVALSPGYVPDSDPEEDSEEEHADYHVTTGDGDDEPPMMTLMMIELGLTTPAPGYEIGESSAAGAARQPGERPEYTLTELDTTVRQRTEEFEVRFEEARDDRAYLGALINTLYRERIQHRRTALAIDREAIYARIAWTSSEERSAAI